MKKYLIILFVLLAASLVGTVSAYGIYLNCSPTKLPLGDTVKCAIDSDFPPGTGYAVTFYQSQYTATQIASKDMTIQTGNPTQYVLFDTTGLKGGQYKVEIAFNGVQPDMRSDSVSSMLVTLTDRSGEISLTSPTTQNLADALVISGTLKSGGNSGIQVQVDGENAGRVFGPQWIQTTNKLQNGDGMFSTTVPVTQADDYSVTLSDSKGTIGTFVYHVVAPTTATTVPPTTAVKTVATTKTTIPTPVPTTKSPLPVFLVLGALAVSVVLIASRK